MAQSAQSNAPTSTKTSKASKAASATPTAPSLIICRNKHWRHISSFHGPWLQMPLELLEAIANINYNTPLPRPIDAASFFDLVKVRRLVDEATNLAVRAASDIASPILTNVNGTFPNVASMNAFNAGVPGHGAKLSRERKYRMREQASQKLARAYRLDEIACSVATMQGASPLEEVGGLVLQRNLKDLDAKYVHFFHEKIPSRQLAESTDLQPLTDIISALPREPEALRTRATVKVFKEDFDGAASDLTEALSLSQRNQRTHDNSLGDVQSQEPQRNRRRPHDVVLGEKDQPSSFEGQILFYRASVYLTLACRHAKVSMPTTTSATNGSHNAATDTSNNDDQTHGLTKDQLRQQVESRKLTKTLAKRAIKDFLAFISKFQYSPNLPTKVAKEFNDRINLVAHGIRSSRPIEPQSPAEPHIVYPLSDLFRSVPPSDLPPYPSQEIVKVDSKSYTSPPPTSCESVTFHPLLNDALHSLLLCHCLAQTSTKELQRHAYMVSRIVRLSDGYPIFQASRSPARADWIEVIRRTENWLNLSSSWEVLCAPAPLPIYDTEIEQHKTSPNPTKAASAAAALINGGAVASAAEEKKRKDRIREQAIMDALDDERVTDEESFRAAVEARENCAQQEHSLFHSNATSTKISPNGSNGNSAKKYTNNTGIEASMRRWSAEDSREYSILTERAGAIAKWVQEAPVVTGTSKRKKRTKKPSPADHNDNGADGVEDEMANLELEEPAET